jgi:hypothetical protein
MMSESLERGFESVDTRTVVIVILFGVVVIVFLLRFRYSSQYSKMVKHALAERDLFLRTFDPSVFIDFDVLSFQAGGFSHIGPFPSKRDGEWYFTVYLAGADFEDVGTIVHEIVECTVGRIIERQLQLKKPLYLLRKQEDKFWVNGRQQKYLVEHIVTTFSELGSISAEKLRERVAAEDIANWRLLDLG